MARTLRSVMVFVCLVASTSLIASDLIPLGTDGTTVRDMVNMLRQERENRRALRASGVCASIVSDDSTNDAFIIPAAGSLAGSNGTFFKSDVSIANHRGVGQVVSIGFLQRGINNGSAAVQKFTIPANTTTMDQDFIATVLGKSGLGTLLVIAVTSTTPGAPPDTNAQIDGFSRIWTPQPVLPGQSASVGSVSQSFEAIDLLDNLLGSYAYGARQDENFRSNVGLVNLYDTANTFTIQVIGTRGSTSFQQTVQPYSMEQPGVPAGIYGDFFVRIDSAASNSNWWSAYVSSNDNRTGDGWVSHVH